MIHDKLRKFFRFYSTRNQQGWRRRRQLGFDVLESRLTPAIAGTPNQNLVAQAYLDVLGRSVDAAGLDFWTGLLDHGASPLQVVLGIQSGQEYRQREVTLTFSNVLGHAPDSTALNSGVAFLQSGGRIEQFEEILYGSPEFYRDGGGTNDGFLTLLFISSLNRPTSDGKGNPVDPVDPQGRGVRQDWEQVLASGVSRTEVAALLDHGAEGVAIRVNAISKDVLQRALLPNGATSAGISTFTDLESAYGLDVIRALIIASLEDLQRIGQNPPAVPGINTTHTVLSPPASTSVALDTPVTFQANVSPASDGRYSVTNDEVDLLDTNGTVLGKATVDASGKASFTTSLLTGGTNQVTAAFRGDANFGPSASGPVTMTVSKATPTTSLSSSAPIAGAGTTVTFKATVNALTDFPPTGPSETVTFTVDGTDQAPQPVVFNAADNAYEARFSTSTLAPQVQPHKISARYNGDTNYNASTNDNTIDQRINLASAATPTVTVTVDASSNNPSRYGDPVTFDSVIGNIPAGFTALGTLVFTDQSNGNVQIGQTIPVNGNGPYKVTATGLAASTVIRSHTIVATFTPTDTANFNTGFGSVVQVVNPAQANLTLQQTTANPIATGGTASFSASVTVANSSSQLPSGATVTFTLTNNGTTIDTKVVSLGGGTTAPYTTPSLTGGPYTVTASVQPGDSNFVAGSAQSISFSVPATPVISVQLDSSYKVGQNTVPLDVSVSTTGGFPVPSGTVSITATRRPITGLPNVSITAGPMSLVGGSVMLSLASLPAGVYDLTVTYSSTSSNYNSASNSSHTLTFVDEDTDGDPSEDQNGFDDTTVDHFTFS
jgi:hypothetical protein